MITPKAYRLLLIVLVFVTCDSIAVAGFPDLPISHGKVKELIDEARVHEKRGSTHRSIELYTEAIGINPLSLEAWNERGWVYLRLGEYKQAISDFSQGLKLSPQSPEGFAARGLAYYYAGKQLQAVSDLTSAIKLGSSHGEVFRLRGDAFIELKEWDAAIQDYEMAEKRGVSEDAIYENKTMALFSLEQYAKALPGFSKNIAEYPERGSNYVNRAEVYFRLGMYDLALKDIDRAIEHGFKTSRIYVMQGYSLFEQRLHDQAKDALLKSLEINPGAIEASLLVAHIDYHVEQQFGNAIKRLKALLENHSDNVLVKVSLGYMLSTCPDDKYNDGELAVRLTNGLSSQSDDEESYFYLDLEASAYARNGQFQKAAMLQQKAVLFLKTNDANPDLIKEYEFRLTEYEAGRPFSVSIEEQLLPHFFNSF